MPPGPPPKKDAERRRRNKSSAKDGSRSHIPAEVVNVDELLVGEVEIPKMDDDWHEIAKQLWSAQIKSGQVIWMEPSDWALLYMMCESISRDMKPQVVGITEDGEVKRAKIPLKGASLSSYIKLANQLLMAEGGRRILRIELERQKRIDASVEDAGKVVSIVERRADLFRQNTAGS